MAGISWNWSRKYGRVKRDVIGVIRLPWPNYPSLVPIASHSLSGTFYSVPWIIVPPVSMLNIPLVILTLLTLVAASTYDHVLTQHAHEWVNDSHHDQDRSGQHEARDE